MFQETLIQHINSSLYCPVKEAVERPFTRSQGKLDTTALLAISI